jgi:hypothetical protein
MPRLLDPELTQIQSRVDFASKEVNEILRMVRKDGIVGPQAWDPVNTALSEALALVAGRRLQKANVATVKKVAK